MNTYKNFMEVAGDAILADVKERGETPLSNITFMMGIAQLQVRLPNGKKKKVNYSAAADPLHGYRKLSLKKKMSL